MFDIWRQKEISILFTVKLEEKYLGVLVIIWFKNFYRPVYCLKP